MLDHRVVRRLLDLLPLLQDALPDHSDFVEFWAIAFRRLSDHVDKSGQSQHTAVRASLGQLLKFLESGDDTAETPHAVRESILGGVSILLSEEELPGKPTDPTTALGFYRLQSSIVQPESGFRLVFPYFLGEFERTFQGSALVCSSAAAHGCADTDTLAALAVTADSIVDSLSLERHKEVHGCTSRAVDEILLSTPFLVLLTTQDYYQCAPRFYRQGDLEYYKCALTSGCVIPEDFYSQAIYETAGPGLATEGELTPGSFAGPGIARSGFFRGLAARARAHHEVSPVQLNPYRPIYFDNALAAVAERGGHIHVLVDVESTSRRLRDRVEWWWDRSKDSAAYIEDVVALIARFLGEPGLSIHWVRSLETAWRRSLPDHPLAPDFREAPVAAPLFSSLVSSRLSVYTTRGPLSHVNKGFWVNPAVLEYIEPTPRVRWELVPLHLLGFSSETVDRVAAASGRGFLLDRFIHEPLQRLQSAQTGSARESNRHARHAASAIVDELLRPNVERLVHPASQTFLTLSELTGVFDRSYARLRHWINEYNLGQYSSQAHDHRFTQQDLERFVEVELANRRGFDKGTRDQLHERIRRAFTEKP